jgi:hypothetical protein
MATVETRHGRNGRTTYRARPAWRKIVRRAIYDAEHGGLHAVGAKRRSGAR